MKPAIARIAADASSTEAGVGVNSSEMSEALLVANVPEDQARAAAAEVAKGQELASESDLFGFGAQLRTVMDKRFGAADKRFGEIEKSLALLKFAVFSGGSIILVLLIKLEFIP